MSQSGSRRRTSLQMNQGLEGLGQVQQNHPTIIRGSQSSIQRKGGLKPQSQRMYSQKKIENQNKVPTSKSIKSTRSIQFKNSNEFQRFTYVKQGIQGQKQQYRGGSVPNILHNGQNDGQCCQIM